MFHYLFNVEHFEFVDKHKPHFPERTVTSHCPFSVPPSSCRNRLTKQAPGKRRRRRRAACPGGGHCEVIGAVLPAEPLWDLDGGRARVWGGRGVETFGLGPSSRLRCFSLNKYRDTCPPCARPAVGRRTGSPQEPQAAFGSPPPSEMPLPASPAPWPWAHLYADGAAAAAGSLYQRGLVRALHPAAQEKTGGM